MFFHQHILGAHAEPRVDLHPGRIRLQQVERGNPFAKNPRLTGLTVDDCGKKHRQVQPMEDGQQGLVGCNHRIALGAEGAGRVCETAHQIDQYQCRLLPKPQILALQIVRHHCSIRRDSPH